MRGTTSKDHKEGTIKYLAPEVLRLKESQSEDLYGTKVDVWALALVDFELFFRPPRVRVIPNLSNIKTQRLRMRTLKKSSLPIATTLQKMLLSEVDDRPSIAEVASWSIWPQPSV